MKRFFGFLFMVTACSAFAQKGDELLVYSIKGNVTVIENNQESKARIGKILKPAPGEEFFQEQLNDFEKKYLLKKSEP